LSADPESPCETIALTNYWASHNYFVMKIAVVSCRLLQLELVGPRGQWQSLQQLDAGLLLGGVT